ncbi:bactofilin family protein [Ferruginibacter albus]|uniref:bactofilin family protein n=1 Tax=Ferruginibacter albus TaxID=2875540 RepID=UPI001CC4F1FA|nr:polymer-forming cytoskeletal protein [Ferruginibacter albus]UAY51491.1 polymer-forming cytoskeletal protein [Ferruginibacter albus]
MFNSKNQPQNPTFGSTTIIGAGTIITGDIESNNDIRIDGAVSGNVISKAKILIGKEGIVNGDIQCQQADISGRVAGKIQVSELLQLRDKANVNGDIYASQLQIEPTATFNGQCHMGANIVDMKAEISNAINQ